MHRLVYFSQSSDQNFRDLKSILTQSQKNNAEAGITGILLCYQGSYIQVLEGELAALTNLYEKKITKDPRHKYIVKLITQPISERLFPKWSMECCLLDKLAEFSEVDEKAWADLMSISSTSSLADVERILAPFRGDDIIADPSTLSLRGKPIKTTL